MALPIFIGEKMAKHILSCSFGKDSIATALLALQHGEPLDELVYCEVMFSEEISGELPEHNRFIHETAIPYFEQRGIPTRVLRSEKTYLSCFYHVVTRGKTKGMLSGFPLSGRCTIQRDCKLPPIKAYQKALPPDTVQYIGIAADEPKRLARLKPGQISLLDKYHVAEPEARSMCAAEELLSPLYDFTKRGGCWFCPNASISELRHLYRYHPELWQLLLDQADRHPGAEHGTAKWGSTHTLNLKYRNTKQPAENYILTENVRFSTDSHAHKHNLNIIVIGGSGSGKTRFYVKPNALQLIGSYLFLDPKGELTRTLGRIMETKGISVTVLDLVHFQGHYNPMAYLETDEDAIKLAFAIVNNTKPKDAPSSGDKFWDDSSVLLISALILYLMYEAPASEQNFSTLMYMILNCQVSENEMVENPLMMLFGELERRDPQHPAVLQFKSFMLGAKKTLQSILISAAANLYMFNSRKFAEMTSRDEMFLPRMGLEQRALFIVLPDNDTTFNFIATMLYTQLFDQLFRLADSTPEYNGALPVHVRLMMDEFANVALPKNFKNILAVCRSRNISCDIILQNIAQLKSLFKDDWEGIIGNCDTLLYLGGNEYGTYEYLSKILGKETERTKSQSIGKGSRGSSSDSLQTAGRELCMPDEIRRMRDDECLLLMRSEDPVIDKKYNLLHHPNVKYTSDAGGEPYVMPPDYMGDAVTITMGAVAAATAPEITEEMYEQLDYLEKHLEENYYENEENFSQYDQGD